MPYQRRRRNNRDLDMKNQKECVGLLDVLDYSQYHLLPCNSTQCQTVVFTVQTGALSIEPPQITVLHVPCWSLKWCIQIIPILNVHIAIYIAYAKDGINAHNAPPTQLHVSANNLFLCKSHYYYTHKKWYVISVN
jgi:hypothetical protein